MNSPSTSAADYTHGAEIREGLVVTGDSAAMAYCLHENINRDRFIVHQFDAKTLFCEKGVGEWIHAGVDQHFKRLDSMYSKGPTAGNITRSLSTPITASPPAGKPTHLTGTRKAPPTRRK